MWIYDAAPCAPKDVIPVKAAPDLLPQSIHSPAITDDPRPALGGRSAPMA